VGRSVLPEFVTLASALASYTGIKSIGSSPDTEFYHRIATQAVMSTTDQACSAHLDLQYFIFDDLKLPHGDERRIRGSVGLTSHGR
jgi:hypothetical protein